MQALILYSPRGIPLRRRAINRVRDNAHKLAFPNESELKPALNARAPLLPSNRAGRRGERETAEAF